MISCSEPGCDNKVKYLGQYCLVHMDYICKDRGLLTKKGGPLKKHFSFSQENTFFVCSKKLTDIQRWRENASQLTVRSLVKMSDFSWQCKGRSNHENAYKIS